MHQCSWHFSAALSFSVSHLCNVNTAQVWLCSCGRLFVFENKSSSVNTNTCAPLRCHSISFCVSKSGRAHTDGTESKRKQLRTHIGVRTVYTYTRSAPTSKSFYCCVKRCYVNDEKICDYMCLNCSIYGFDTVIFFSKLICMLWLLRNAASKNVLVLRTIALLLQTRR